MRKWMALLLCLAMLAGLCGCGASETKQPVQTETETTQETILEELSEPVAETMSSGTLSSSAMINGVAELVPEYARMDMDAILDDCERLAACTQDDEVVALYDALYEQYCEAGTNYNIAFLCNIVDVTDEYWAEEAVWSTSAYNVIADALRAACCAVLEGPCADALREHLGDEIADWFLEYVDSNEQTQQLLERESELCNEYSRVDNEIRTMLVEVDGESWSYEMLYSEEGDELFLNDYDRYRQIEQAVFGQINEQLGSIYVELVALRQEIAEQVGCDSYIDYMYESYGRTYDGEQAQEFCDAVKKITRETNYYSDLYYSGIGTYYDIDPIEPEELVALLGEYAAEIDPLVYDCWEYMTENELYMLPSDSVCDTGGYTVNLPSTGAPYIYDYITGDAVYDFDGLSHEFGHFMNAWLAKSPNVLIYGGDYDIGEIHSTGLEMLYAAYYDEIFGDGADAASDSLLLDKIDNVVTGCLYDEFQRRVYATENITLDDVNRIYSELCAEYGEFDEVGDNHSWMFVHHNFDQPLYYISYAASALVALQIWEISLADYDAAVQLWLDFVHEGGFTKSYMEAVAESGLKGFTEKEAVTEVLSSAMNYLLENG